MATGGEPTVPTANNCKDCKSSLNLGKEILSCTIHYIWLCRNCLSERARERIGFNCDDCAIGRSKIYIFMDHSNTWIEAKKIKASGEYTQDSRIRLEAGKLISCVTRERLMAAAELYGSEPPPLDSVWDSYGEKGWKITAHQRSSWTGKEKCVDTHLVADITDLVGNVSIGKHTIAIISGDEDVLPAVRKALAKHWKVEVHFWERSMSAALKKEKGIKICFLDDHYQKICFTDRNFSPSPQYMSLIRANGIVVSFASRKSVNDCVIQIESITGLHARYFKLNELKQFEEDIKSQRLFVVVFEIPEEKFQVANVMQKYKGGEFPFIKTLDTFISLASPATNNGIQEECDEKKEPDLSAVNMKRVERSHKRKPDQVSSSICHYGRYCSFGTKCKKRHSTEDKEYFKCCPEARERRRKTELCSSYVNGKCRRYPRECNYAHGEDDAVCMNCHQKGHLKAHCICKLES